MAETNSRATTTPEIIAASSHVKLTALPMLCTPCCGRHWSWWPAVSYSFDLRCNAVTWLYAARNQPPLPVRPTLLSNLHWTLAVRENVIPVRSVTRPSSACWITPLRVIEFCTIHCHPITDTTAGLRLIPNQCWSTNRCLRSSKKLSTKPLLLLMKGGKFSTHYCRVLITWDTPVTWLGCLETKLTNRSNR